MHIHIAICDDDPAALQYLQGVVSAWARQEENHARVSCYGSAEAFLFAWAGDKSFDILLLDIQMGGMDGVALAKRLREADSRVQIVFITGYPDFIAEGYEVAALHYLMKPVREDKLREVLGRAAGSLGKAGKTLLLNTPGGMERLELDSTLYAEAFAHAVAVHTNKGTIEARLPIGELERLAGGGFFRCHRSYLVNLAAVSRLTKTDAILDDGTPVPVARKQYGALNRAFIRYHREERA